MKVRSRSNISSAEIKKILVRYTNWVGDTVMTVPSLTALKRAFSSAQVTVLANPWVIALLDNHPAVERTVELAKGRGLFSSCRELSRVIWWLRRERFDLAVLFQNAFEAAFLAYMGGVRYIVGYDTEARGLLLTHKVIRDRTIRSVHQVEYYLGLMEAMGWPAKERKPVLYVSDEDIESTSSMLPSGGKGEDRFVVGLNPGAIYGPAKRWPEDRFALIGDRAANKWGATVLLFGSSSEKAIGARVADAMHTNPTNLCGRTTLGQAMALIRRCGFFLTNDSGLMHVAAAFDIPMVAIFGPTDPTATGPISPNARIVRHSIDCSPCLKESCPYDHRCMLSIDPEEVWEEMESLRREVRR